MTSQLLEAQSETGGIDSREDLSPPSEHRLQWKMVITVFSIATIAFMLSPVITNYDSFAAIPTAVALVNHHTLDLDAYRHVRVLANSYTVAHTRGHLVTSYPWAVGLFAVPAVLVVDLIHLAGGPSADALVTGQGQIQNLVEVASASVTTGGACATLALLAYRRLRGSPHERRRWALISGLTFAFATSAWSTASRALWQQGPSLLFLALALVALDRIFPRDKETRRPNVVWASFGAGAFLAGAVTMRPTNAVALVLATIIVLPKATRRSARAYLSGVAAVLLPWALVTMHYYGTFIQPYDQASKLGFPSTFFESIAAQLISPSRGLFIFSPIALVAVAGIVLAYRRHQCTELELLSSLAVPAYLFVIALFPVWWAGTSFGPRFMTETLPFLFVLAIPFVEWIAEMQADRKGRRPWVYRIAALCAATALVLSVLINAQGGLLRSSICWNLKSPTSASVDDDLVVRGHGLIRRLCTHTGPSNPKA